MRKTFALFLLFALLSAQNQVFCADYSDYKSKAKQFLNENNKGKAAGKIEDIPIEPPKSRFIDSAPAQASEEDKRHVTVHMKLANRHFSKKNYPKAQEEVKKVFSRDPNNSGGHFMLAVIAGRHKQYKEAWYHIDAAQEKDSNNSKIKDFISKLKTVSQKPDSEWIPGIHYGIPVDASERTFDLLEKLLADKCSQNITNIEFSDFVSGSEVTQDVVFSALDSFNPNDIISLLKKSNGYNIVTQENSNKKLKLKLTYKNTKAENPNAKQIKGINDFVNDLLEDMPEIAIINTDEAEPANGIQEITYEVSAREFSSINKFFRQISPYSTKYYIQTMDLAYIPGNQSATIWKTKIKVSYKI